MKKPVITGFFLSLAPKGALVYGILQAFASLKSRHITGRDLDGFTRTRIASGAGRTGLHRERSEADERYRTAVGKRSSNAVEYRVDCLGRISA